MMDKSIHKPWSSDRGFFVSAADRAMNLSSLFGKAASEPIEAIGNVVDAVFTSDDERLSRQEALARLATKASVAQTEIAKVQATHRSLFVSGARPALLWVCASGYAFAFLFNPLFQWYTGSPGPVLPLDAMGELTLGMLGLASLRTIEKLRGKTK